MAEKTVNSRIQVKRDSSTNWGKATKFRPKEGEIIFYSDLNQIKIGKKGTDGNDMLLKDLPFLQVTAEEIGDHNHDTQYYSIDTLDAKFEAIDKSISEARNYSAGNGIAISDDGTISVTFAAYAGAFEGNGELEGDNPTVEDVVGNYSITFRNVADVVVPYVYFSLNDGASWKCLSTVYASNTITLSNVYQIKFKIIPGYTATQNYTISVRSYQVKDPTTHRDTLASYTNEVNGSNEVVGTNFVLIRNVSDMELMVAYGGGTN